MSIAVAYSFYFWSLLREFHAVYFDHVHASPKPFLEPLSKSNQLCVLFLIVKNIIEKLIKSNVCCPNTRCEHPLECGQPLRGRPPKETPFSLCYQYQLLIAPELGMGFMPSFSLLGLFLAWPCTVLVHVVPTTMSSYLQLLCCVGENTASLYSPTNPLCGLELPLWRE